MRSVAQGFTLIELLVVVAISAILLTVVVPSFADLLAKRRLEGAANELSANLQYTRTQAVADNTNVVLATTGNSYTITGNQTYKTAILAGDLSMTTGVNITFFPLRGCTNSTCTSSTDTIAITSSTTTGSLVVKINNMGRVQLCVPSGFSFTGYAAC